MLIRFLSEVWLVLTAMAPWLFVGAALAGMLKWVLPEGFVARHVGRPSAGSVVKTTLLGIPLPLCSCGVLPAAISLKKDGASDGAAVGFLISTPQTGVDSILVTASFLGWPLALFKVLAALVTGIVGGLLTLITGRRSATVAASASPACPLPAGNAGSGWRAWTQYSINELIGGVYLYIAIGILLAGAISTWIPAEALSRVPWLQGVGGMGLMLLIALPMYICSTGSVPIAASLVVAGLPVGSALVLLMAGPATNAATLAAVARTFGRRITVIYVSVVIAGSMLFGWLFQSWLGAGGAVPFLEHAGHYPAWRHVLNQAAAAALVLLSLRWAALDLHAWWRRVRPVEGLQEMELPVGGMSCERCASHIQRELATVPGVHDVEVRVQDGRVRVRGRNLRRAALATAIVKAGYTVCGA